MEWNLRGGGENTISIKNKTNSIISTCRIDYNEENDLWVIHKHQHSTYKRVTFNIENNIIHTYTHGQDMLDRANTKYPNIQTTHVQSLKIIIRIFVVFIDA